MADSKLRVNLIGDASSLNRSLQVASKRLETFGKKATQVGKDLSLRLTLPIGAAAGAAIKMASDMEESTNKVNVAFGSSSKQVRDFAKTSLRSFGIAESSALDMTALFGDMATGMGVSQSEAANLSTELVSLAGDLASFKNINIEEVTTALSGVFTGETESLKRLGIVMTEVNLEQFRLNQGIAKSVKEMTQQEKIMLRLRYIFSVTQNAQGDFARTSDSAANQMRQFTEGLKELGASFGETVLPLFTEFVTKANTLLLKFKALDDETKRDIVTYGLLAAAIPPVIFVVGQLADALSFAARMAKLLMSAEALGGLAKVFKLIGGATGAAVIATIAGAGIAFDQATKKIAPNLNVFEKAAAAIQGMSNPLAGVNQLLLDNAKQSNAARPPVRKLAQAFIQTRGIKPLGEQLAITGATITHFKPLVSAVQTVQKGLVGVSNAFGGLENAKAPIQSFKATVDEMSISVASIAQQIGTSLFTAVANGSNAMQALGKTILGALGDILIQMGGAAVAASNLSSTFAVPIVGAAAGFAAIALGTFMKGIASRVNQGGIAAFANGGIVSAPTLGLMGEYAGVRSNPEVIAPLDRLQSMLGFGRNDVNVTGQFRLDGQDLVVAVERANNQRNNFTG